MCDSCIDLHVEKHEAAVRRTEELIALERREVAAADTHVIHQVLEAFPGSRLLEIRPSSKKPHAVKPTTATAPGVQLTLRFGAREQD